MSRRRRRAEVERLDAMWLDTLRAAAESDRGDARQLLSHAITHGYDGDNLGALVYLEEVGVL